MAAKFLGLSPGFCTLGVGRYEVGYAWVAIPASFLQTRLLLSFSATFQAPTLQYFVELNKDLQLA